MLLASRAVAIKTPIDFSSISKKIFGMPVVMAVSRYNTGKTGMVSRYALFMCNKSTHYAIQGYAHLVLV